MKLPLLTFGRHNIIMGSYQIGLEVLRLALDLVQQTVGADGGEGDEIAQLQVAELLANEGDVVGFGVEVLGALLVRHCGELVGALDCPEHVLRHLDARVRAGRMRERVLAGLEHHVGAVDQDTGQECQATEEN